MTLNENYKSVLFCFIAFTLRVMQFSVTVTADKYIKMKNFNYLEHLKARFPLQPYRSKMQRISLFREHSGKTHDDDTDTIEYATFRYDTVKVENWLKIPTNAVSKTLK